MNENTSYKKVDDAVVQSFESAWAEGHPVAIEEAIQPSDSSLRLATLEELVHIDMEFRWKQDSSENLPVETYLERFAELKQPEVIAALARHEYRLRSEQGETLSPTEYEDRFAGLAGLPGKEDTVPTGQAPDTAQEMPTMMRPPGDPPREPPTGDTEQPTMMKVPDTVDAEKDPTWPDQQDTDGENQTGIEGIPGYQLLGELGRGGMGVVYQARDQKLKRTVALKMILSGAHASDEDMQRFQIEAEAVARLQHPNIVQIFEVGEHQGNPYISLEYQQGGGLDQKIAGKPQNIEESAKLIETLSRAMEVAHQQGIIHRDLKPANILLSSEGEPKITDFGLAKRMDDDSNQTKTGAVMGTPSYMPPEQASSSIETLGPAADTYALGAILYHLLTGRPPFQSETQLDTLMQVISDEPVPPSRLNSNVPADLETICLKCLQKDIKRRYATAAALAEDLRRFQTGEPIAARPVSALERGWKWARRRPAVAGVIGVSALALISLIAGGLWYNAQLQDSLTVAENRRQEAQEQRELAEKQRKVAEKQKEAADRNFKLARDAVDELTTVSQDELFNLPQMEPVRRALLEKAKAFYETFVEQSAGDPELMVELSKAHWRLGSIYYVLADHSSAQREYDTAIGIISELLKENPSEPSYLFGLACIHQSMGNTLSAIGNEKESAEQHNTTIELSKRLVNNHPKVVKYQKILAEGHVRAAMIENHLGFYKHADDHSSRGVVLYERLVELQSHNLEYVAALGLAYLTRAEVLEAQPGSLETRGPLINKAVTIHENLVREHPDVPKYASGLSQAYVFAAALEEELGNYKGLIAFNRKIVSLCKTLADYYPNRPKYAADLANGYVKLAYGLMAKSFDEQKKAFGMGNDELEKKTKEVSNQGVEEALLLLAKGIEISEQLVEDNPGVPDYHETAIQYYSVSSEIQVQLGNYAQAIEQCDKLIESATKMAKAHPDTPRWGIMVQLTYCQRGILSARIGNYKMALASLTPLTTLQQGMIPQRFVVQIAYNNACLLSLVSDTVRKDSTLPKDQQETLHDQYAARAVHLLVEAKSGGWFDDPANVIHLKKTDTDLDPLRERDDFKKFVETLKTD